MNQKDKLLFLESVLKTFILLLMTSFLFRLIGFNSFQFEVENDLVIQLVTILYHNYLGQWITLYLSSFIILKLICKTSKSKIYHIVTFLITTLNISTQILLSDTNANHLYTILNIFILLLGIYAIDKNIPIKRTALIFSLNILYQALALFVRNINYHIQYDEIYQFLFHIDYILLLFITYFIHQLKQNQDISIINKFFLVNKNKKVKKLPVTLKERQETLSNHIYNILSLLWNLTTLGIVVFVCTLNTTLITTIFLIFAFVTTKSNFGKTFHMKNARSCFVVSNIIYFILSRITISIHYSFIIPILLGVGLSYGSSRLAKIEIKEEPKEEWNFYRGMPEKTLETISQKHYLNTYEINLLKDFYCKRMTLLQLSVKYNYSKDTIYYHKKKALQKIKDHH